MTKKHFIALADAIREHNKMVWQVTFDDAQIATLADFCQSQNDRFDRELWLNYITGECGPNGGAIKPQKELVAGSVQPSRALPTRRTKGEHRQH